MMGGNERSGCIGQFVTDAVPFSAITADIELIPLFGFCFFVKDHKKKYNQTYCDDEKR